MSNNNVQISTGLGVAVKAVDVGAASAAAVTITIATPGVVTDTAHGYATGQPLTLSTTGALPTGLSVATTYFVLNPAGNTYQLSATEGGAAINTTGTQSGVHTRQAIEFAQVVQINNANPNGAAVAASSTPVVLANDTGLLAVAHTAAPTAKTDGQVVPFVADKVGRLVTVPAIRDLVASSGVVTVSTTAETTLMAAVASSTFLDLTAIKLVNTSATGVRVDLRDATGGTVVDTWYLPPVDDRGQSYPVPRKQTSVNTNWTIQLSGAVTDVRVVADFIKNI